jgi:hypothetical protein
MEYFVMRADQRCKVPTVVANALPGFKGGSGVGFAPRDMPGSGWRWNAANPI